MISLPGLFLAVAGAALVAALVALWSSVRSAFGGGPGVLVETARDLPDHAQLVEEKHSLLRAIKDLEYERAVGKIGDSDFARLDAAYRARAKQVLAQLDRDVKPLYEEAERLIEARRAQASAAEQTARPKKRKGKVSERPVTKAAPAEVEAETEAASAEEHETDIDAGSTKDEGPSIDEVLTRIREGTVTEAPEPPAHWPADAKKMWSSTLGRALEDKKKKDASA